jgi:hypothetical protein
MVRRMIGKFIDKRRPTLPKLQRKLQRASFAPFVLLRIRLLKSLRGRAMALT